ncbi:unnamed protein product [Cuscuta campestris]|uniref:Fe2OG dioxygenase domain-containing protein n=1 Tax=Cuscuta campestris TaxID=132261 RepID=A0A484LJG2_9ASTE|nr:unnamed protein product [Cuscuta campestris]
MSGAINGHSPDSGGRRSFMDLARSLGREEILEILSGGLCGHCEGVLQTRIENLKQNNSTVTSSSADNGKAGSTEFCSVDSSDAASSGCNGVRLDRNSPAFVPSGCPDLIESKYLNRAKKFDSDSSSLSDSGKNETTDLFWGNSSDCVSNDRRLDSPSPPPGNPRGNEPSYLNLFMKADSDSSSSPASVNCKQKPVSNPNIDICLNDGLSRREASQDDKGLSEEQKEHIRLAQVKRKKGFVHYEKVEGRKVNVLDGLELHSQVFNAAEQSEIVESVYKLQRMGQQGQLRERTYTEPRKWMRGKGRATIQFGCCYNYAVDKNGNPPGILREEEVDPLPPIFKKMIKRMVRFRVLPPTCVPNSCIVNIYDEGDCIPPHIDHHDFVRPFCTVSFLSECNILFGSSLKIVSPGEFSGPVSIPLPVGSVLILQGNGADVAKHCVPAVPSKRISVTFRKMDESKLPYCFRQDPELSKVVPLVRRPQPKEPSRETNGGNRSVGPAQNNLASSEEYPPLGSVSSSKRRTSSKSSR